MKKFLTLTLALIALGWVSFAAATSNLNSSKSNIYRVITDGVNVAAILPKLDQAGSGVNEATVRKILNDAGVSGINKILILQPNTIILLTNPADEQEARKMAGASAPGAGGPANATTVKGSKSNGSY